MNETNKSTKRLWHPFAVLLAGLIMMGLLWFSAGYCFGYGDDHPQSHAVTTGLVGVGFVLAVSGLALGGLTIAGVITSFPDGAPSEAPRRLWHPFAVLLAGLTMVSLLWFGAGYCFGYGSDYPQSHAVTDGLMGVGFVLVVSGLVLGKLTIAGMIVLFPDDPPEPWSMTTPKDTSERR